MRVSNSDLFKSINTAFDTLSRTKSFEELLPVVKASELVSESVQQKDSFWQELLTLICSMFGYVTEFKQLQLDAQRLQTQLDQRLSIFSYSDAIHLNATSLSNLQALQAQREADPVVNQLRAQLNDVKSSMRGLSILISDEAKSILTQFDYVEEMIGQLEEQNSAPSLDQTQLDKSLKQANDAATFLKAIENSIYEMAGIYDENSYDLTAIIPLVNSYECVVERLQGVQEDIRSKSLGQNSHVNRNIAAARSAPIGGIINGGNTCYLASAMQTVNVIPSYRRALDPHENQLMKRSGETDASFAQRQSIQRMGFEILQTVNSGVLVQPEEINAFRQACFNYEDKGTRIVDTPWGFADAAETLHRLLEAMDYRFEYYSVQRTRTADSDQYVVVESDSSDYRTMDELSNRTSDSNLEVSAAAYLGGIVSMQQLIDENWQNETINQVVKVLCYKEDGAPEVREYSSFTLSKAAAVAEAPEVIKITIKQSDGLKATISHAETIYPFGEGKGPKYELKAAIEHRPSHYVAHLFQNGRILEANDRLVHNSKADLPAFAYYYVRSEDSMEF
ncbi:MAG: hypothetical protein ACHQUC_09280 [Chlamydiales bacterium]